MIAQNKGVDDLFAMGSPSGGGWGQKGCNSGKKSNMTNSNVFTKFLVKNKTSTKDNEDVDVDGNQTKFFEVENGTKKVNVNESANKGDKNGKNKEKLIHSHRFKTL